MTDTLFLTPAELAAALAVPEEAFRAFVRLRGVAWETRLPGAEAASLALAWVAAGGSAAGPVAEAASTLVDALGAVPR
ncbi:MAG: hypothetical protein O9325_17835 [Roseomonas sp.]|nr:hypothetical protein [Roseomonas sp.]